MLDYLIQISTILNMKTMDTIKSFTDRVITGESSLTEAMTVFLVIISVVSACIYLFAGK